MNLIFVFLISIANAGWWSDFCERHLIADDPYQYENYPEAWIVREIARLEIKERWSRIGSRDKKYLKILRAEIEKRKVE